MTYRDMTFCATPDCKNECGRKLTKKDLEYLKKNDRMPVCYGYFCDKKEGDEDEE